MNLETTNHREQGIASIEANKHERSPQELSQEVLSQADRAIEQQSSELKELVGEDIFNQDFVGELANAKAELENELAGISAETKEPTANAEYIEAAKKEISELLGDERANELFSNNEEITEGFQAQLFTNQLQQLRSRYGEDVYKKIIDNTTTPAKDLKDFIEAITDGGVALNPEDLEESKFFSWGEPTELLVNTYRLMKPGLTKDKMAALESLIQTKADAKPTETSTHASRKYIRVEDGFGLDKDDKDYILDPSLEAQVNDSNRAEVAKIAEALSQKKPEAIPTDIEIYKQSVDALFDADSELQDRFSALENIGSANGFSMYHAKFDRSRKIPSFKDSLQKKAATVASAFYLEALNEQKGDAAKANTLATERVRKLISEAVRLYEDVHSPRLNVHGEQYAPSPIEAMRGFNNWLSDEAEKTHKKGEFHVGRDTLMTTYAARQASEWGKVSGKERAQKIKHVDISRTIVNNTPRAILANYLKQNGITEDLMGVDTGYRGTGPQDALLAVMDPEKKAKLITESPDVQVVQVLDQQIKLMEVNAQAQNRTVEYENKFDGIVDWMEQLPKYTERSQYLSRSFDEGNDKLLVVSTERNPSEQLFAWVIQSAVWREFVAKKKQEEQP